jgi:protein-S-isoprenylcysteine O-methyltransferase Ste14
MPSSPYPLVLLVGTLLLAFFSRGSLNHPRSHGFPRFFAFEAMLLLGVVNHPYWHEDLSALHQNLSWGLFLVSLAVVLQALTLLVLVGRHDKQRRDPSLLVFEKTARLVTGGIFRWIRHPMYTALILFAWGMFFKHASWPAAALGVTTTLCLVLTARREEVECMAYFGEEYATYMARSRRFIPGIY